MLAIGNLDLLSVGIAVAATLVLGFTIYVSNPSSITAKTFLFFSIITAIWGSVNFLSYQFSDSSLTLLLFRGIMFSAVWQAFFLYQLFLVFPADSYAFSSFHKRVLAPIVGLTSLLTLTPLVFRGINSMVISGQVSDVSIGPGLPLFGIVAVGLVLSALYTLISKTSHSKGTERQTFSLMLVGVFSMFTLIIVFNFLIATIFGNPRFIPLGALFTFPFVALAAYAILKHKLFNIKITATALLVFVLSIVTFVEIIFSDTLQLRLFRTGIFALVLAFGVNLIRGVMREVKQREVIQIQAEELAAVNEQQTNLLHFMSHEIKGYLTKSEAAFAAISQGDFGPVNDDVARMAGMALTDVRKGVRTVMDILDASNLKKGTVTFKKTTFDLKSAVHDILEQLKPAIDEKKLAVEAAIAWEVPCMVLADEDKMRSHVIRNLIDNAIKYTPAGTIKVEVVRSGAIVRFSVQDSGIGITDEDKKRLFTEGGHGKDSIKVNVHSTGYGLFIAKSVVEAQGGKIWAESAGAGQGSRFIVELPAA